MNQELQKFYDRAFEWILSVGPRIILAAILLFVGLWIIKTVRIKVYRRLTRYRIHALLQPFIEGIVFSGMQILLVLLVMQVLGIQLTVFAALIAALGAAIGLSLSGTLQNFASGVLILLLKPFQPGDNIVAQGFEGTVTSIRIFYTIVTTFDKRTVIVPNSKLSNEIIVNVTRVGARRLDVELKFKYGTDLPRAKKILYNTITGSADVLKEPVPRIGVSTFVDDGYKMIANIWLNAHGFEDAKLVLHERIAIALNESGVWIEVNK